MTKFNATQLECMRASVKREIRLRKKWYPIWAKDPGRKLTHKQADNEIKIMEKVLELIEEQLAPGNLFTAAGVQLETAQ